MSDIHRHYPELFDFSSSREEPLEVTGPEEECCECGKIVAVLSGGGRCFACEVEGV